MTHLWLRLPILSLTVAFHLAAQPAASVFGTTPEIMAELSRITGFKILHPIKQETMTREKLKVYFEARIKEVVDPEQIRIEELVLKKFGFAPPDFDLKKTTIDLMTEQAAAFYDYRGKKMVLLEGSNDAAQQAALTHELAHALADQHFRLEKYLKRGATDDAALARTAVMEGQATWLMSELLARKVGRSLKDAPELLEMMSNQSGASGAGFPVFDSVPLYMRESLVFPYTKGLVFQNAVIVQLGPRGFAEVFHRPPLSTREVMHPEIYFRREKPVEPKVPVLTGGWKAIAGGAVGEFDLSVLMRQYAFTEFDSAAHWRGGAYRLFEQKKTKRTALTLAIQFDTESGARQFFTGYHKVLAKKWKQTRFADESATRISGEAEEGFFLTTLQGLTVSSIEGTDKLP